jgi:hypothetical protein
VLPPLLAWGALPIYRWLTTPKPLNITKPYTVAPPQPGMYDPNEVIIGYPSPERWEEIMAEERLRNSSASAPIPPKK